MELALALRCSENETVLVAAGKTIALDSYNTGKSSEITIPTIPAKTVIEINGFRFFQMKINNSLEAYF
jgi:hypothetical protein